MADNKKHKSDEGYETTGHEWDGIQEWNKPLPRWWVWTFYATIVWGIWYTIAYPAWPMISGATEGYLGFSTRANVAEDIAQAEAANADINAQLASVELETIPNDPQLAGYAASAGEAVFNTWCVQCHGREGRGFEGYPTLSDDAWLWGGTMEDIHYTVAHGIRNEEDDEARYSEMPAYGEIFSEEEIAQVANYVMTLSGQTPPDAALATAGEELFLDNCAACHMEDGSGERSLGAPTLSDAIWLYGGDYDTIVETVTYSRYGVMPPWNTRLTEAEIRAVAAYVHQLGGGE
jgi:cytochrome c oxidase cbb3-type subunit 3